MAAKMTAEMWRIGARNASIVGLVLLLPVAGLVFAISAVADRSLLDAGRITFESLWIVALILFIYYWSMGKANSGPVLLDCGPAAFRTLILIGAASSVFVGVPGIGNPSGLFLFPGSFFWFTNAIVQFILGLGHVQVRENGIWQNGYLLIWEKIQSYEWSGKAEGALKLHFRPKFLPFAGRGVLFIPDAHKEACCRELEAHGVARV